MQQTKRLSPPLDGSPGRLQGFGRLSPGVSLNLLCERSDRPHKAPKTYRTRTCAAGIAASERLDSEGRKAASRGDSTYQQNPAELSAARRELAYSACSSGDMAARTMTW